MKRGMRGSVFITTTEPKRALPRWDDNGIPQHWIRVDVDDETLIKELPYRGEILEGPKGRKITPRELTRMVSTTTGEVAYAYKGRLYCIPQKPQGYVVWFSCPIIKRYI